MSVSLQTIVKFTALPVAAMMVGVIVAARRPPSAKTQSLVQHFAAGVVLAATAGELIPDLLHHHARVPTLLGFVLGVMVMLGVKHFTEGEAPNEGAPEGVRRRSLAALLVAVGVDLAVDGLLVGVGFAAGEKQGILLVFALTLEVAFVAVATTAELIEAGLSAKQAIARGAGFAALLALFALVGGTLLAGLSGALLVGVLAFGVAALLYLVTEELLVEAHEVPETPVATSVFFAGFLVLLLVEMSA